jgi:hypothetical protein
MEACRRQGVFDRRFHDDNAGAGSEEKGINEWSSFLPVTSFQLNKEIIGTVSQVSCDH